MEYILEDKENIERIKKVMKVLYTEKRLTGDDMRDLAQILQVAVDAFFEFDIDDKISDAYDEGESDGYTRGFTEFEGKQA